MKFTQKNFEAGLKDFKISAQVEQAVMREVAGSIKSVVTRLGVEEEEEVRTQIWKCISCNDC